MAEYHSIPASTPSDGNAFMSAAARDPYPLVKEHVQSSVKILIEDFDRWKELLASTNVAKGTAFTDLNTSLTNLTAKIDTDLNRLRQTVNAVENNRARFSYIDDRELEGRNTFLNEMQIVVDDCRRTMNSQKTREKIERDKKQLDDKKRQKDQSQFAALERENIRVNQQFVDHQQESIMKMHEEQDEVVDDMMVVLKRIGVMAGEMQDELVTQHQMINQINNRVDDVNDKAQMVINRIQKMLNTNDKGKLCAIAVLLVILIALIIVVFLF
eukprot:TRINITY_DN582_c0_g1_i4.p1 TRINITY_DN582_c0_g1~~TRINITY_DN582_c0_g1_i4.p1  ORF type:complete len:270 (-),score=63.27 TRINITY_DN582_c0_g1_i4:381-1190(-)